MKALTIKQPWASLIIHGIKDVENRSWNTKFRGKFLIHSSKTFDTDATLTKRQVDLCVSKGFLKQNDDGSWDWKIDFPRGVILGECNLIDVMPPTATPSTDASIWKENMAFGLVISDAKQLDEPIPVKGNLGFWEYNMK